MVFSCFPFVWHKGTSASFSPVVSIGTVCSKPGIPASSCPSFVQLCLRYQEAAHFVTVPQATL